MTHFRLSRTVAVTTAIAVVSTCLVTSPASADDSPLSARESSVFALEAAAGQNAALAEKFAFTQVADDLYAAESGVSIEGRDLLLGDAYPDISLPVSAEAVAEVSENGDLVFSETETGLSVVIEATDDEVARVLTVARETYGDGPEHRYSYELALPENAVLNQTDDGSVVILAPVSANTQEPNPDLSTVLPPAGDGEEDGTDEEREEHSTGPEFATDEELAGNLDVPAGWQMLGGFQPAWSVDANGVALPSHFEIDGNTLTQVVDTSGAEFPVVSDPLPLVAIGLAAVARALLPAILRAGARALATQAIKVGAKATTRGGYKTFAAFKRAAGNQTPKGNQWHHIVEQSTIKKRSWDARWIHNRNNLVSIRRQVHQKCVNSWMAKKKVNKFGIKSGSKTMREVVHKQSFSKQHQIGVALLRHCGVRV